MPIDAAAEEPGCDGPNPFSRLIIDAAAKLNAGIARVTGCHVDLRTLLAVSLLAWAVRQIVRGRARELSWSTAMWYAYELFRHHGEAVAPAESAGRGPRRAATLHQGS